MDMIQLANIVAAQQEKQAIEHLIQSMQVGYSTPTIFFNPAIGRGYAATATPAKPPQTSLFVGNISDKCTNEFIQQILEECGKVTTWKRIKGSNGKFQAFGFCDFEEPDGTLRALRVLHDFQIGDKKLNLKADDKVRSKLVEEWNRKQILSGKAPFSSALGLKELPYDEEALKIDEEVRLKVLNMIEKDHPELLIVEDGELSDKEKDKKAKEDKRRPDDRKDRARRHSRSRSRTRSRSQRRHRSRTPRHKKRRHHSSSSESDSRSRSGSRSSRSSSRSTDYDKKREKRSRSRSVATEDSEDAREKKALKKQLREKELAYASRLKKWEVRERRMARSYEKEESKEQQRRRDVQKEAKKLRHFLEDYDDERDDVKYYKSSSLFQRRRDYEKEKEQDTLDRKKEIQEIEDLKKQIIAEGKEALDAEEEAKKRHRIQEEEALRKLREDSGSPNPHKPAGTKEGESSEDSESGSSGSDSDDEDGNKNEKAEGGWASTPNETGTPKDEQKEAAAAKWKAAISIPAVGAPGSSNGGAKSPAAKPSPRPDLSQRLNGVFGMDDEEEVEPIRKKLKPFEITQEDRMQVLTPEERKKKAKELIDQIPTSKDKLFAFKIDWSYVDQKLIDTRVKPWVTNKIQHYIGEDEKSLVDFVCEKIQNHVQPDKLLQDMRLILDDEAESFVVKMWRLIIYESESRRMGLGPVDKK